MAKAITEKKRSERWRRDKLIKDKATCYLEYMQRLIKVRRKSDEKRQHQPRPL